MKKSVLTWYFLLVLASFLNGQCRLEIEVTGLRNNTGFVMLQLLDENHEVVNRAKGTIKNKQSMIVFNDLKPGNYAFQYYHDENLSEVMETGLLGKPKEGYGFSNNASGPVGPKPFKEWLFTVNKDIKVIVSPRY